MFHEHVCFLSQTLSAAQVVKHPSIGQQCWYLLECKHLRWGAHGHDCRKVCADIRVNMVVSLADLTSRFPNVLEIWTSSIYKSLEGTLHWCCWGSGQGPERVARRCSCRKHRTGHTCYYAATIMIGYAAVRCRQLQMRPDMSACSVRRHICCHDHVW